MEFIHEHFGAGSSGRQEADTFESDDIDMEEDPGSEGLDGFEIVPPTSSVVLVREVETVSLDDTGEIYILEAVGERFD